MGWYPHVVSTDSWRFWVDAATVLAGVLSLVAIVVALRARAHATEQLARERRRDFELDVLLDLLDRFGELDLSDPSLNSRVLLIGADSLPAATWVVDRSAPWPEGTGRAEPTDLTAETVPRTRIHWGWQEPDGSVTRVASLVVLEIVDAIEQRVSERD